MQIFIRFISAAILFLGLIYSGPSVADISSVSFIHNEILVLKNITLPIDGDVNPSDLPSARYLMRQIDDANLALNGQRTTNYANDPTRAVSGLVSTSRAAADIEQLIVATGIFTLSLENAKSASFYLSASGEFTVNWGDGNIETITRTDVAYTLYSHTYSTQGSYQITINGRATGYSPSTLTPCIKMSMGNSLVRVSGDMGRVFPAIDGVSPSFYTTFEQCAGLKEISPDLFAGVNGPPIPNMFQRTFNGCTELTAIPENLFASIVGAPTLSLFEYTFQGCIKVSGPIPENLFAGISGRPAQQMFYSTFHSCKGLTGEIPANLFAGISGAPAASMFAYTFAHCSGLTSLPSGLFSQVSGACAAGMFNQTFDGCTGLTGTIPANLFGRYSGAQQPMMFYATFGSCSNLTGINSGMWNLVSMAPAYEGQAFDKMFMGCSNITTASPGFSATLSNTRLYQVITGVSAITSTFQGCTKMADYASIPGIWK